METAIRIQKEIAEKKPAKSYNVFLSGMKEAGYKLSAPDAAALYARSGAVTREREKQARQAPPPQAVEGATYSNAAGLDSALQAGAAEHYEEDEPPPLKEELEEEDQPEGPGEGEEEEPQFMPFSDAKECFFFPYQDGETLEEFEEWIAQGVTVVLPEEQELAMECS